MHRKELASCKDFLHVSLSPAGPSTALDLRLTPQTPGLGASWKAGPGAWEGYLLRLSGPLEKTLSLGPGALNVTFPGPLPSGHYTLELRVLAGPYEAGAQATAWLGGESGPVANGLGSCPGVPTLRGVDPHPPGPTPLQMLQPSTRRAAVPSCPWMGQRPARSLGAGHCPTLRGPPASSETSQGHLVPPRSRSTGPGPAPRWTLSLLWALPPQAPQATQVSAGHRVPWNWGWGFAAGGEGLSQAHTPHAPPHRPLLCQGPPRHSRWRWPAGTAPPP